MRYPPFFVIQFQRIGHNLQLKLHPTPHKPHFGEKRSPQSLRRGFGAMKDGWSHGMSTSFQKFFSEWVSSTYNSNCTAYPLVILLQHRRM